MLCEYVGFIRESQIFVCLRSDLLSLSEKMILPVWESELSIRSSRSLRCRKCGQNNLAQNFVVNNKFDILTILET
jgi:hypothetical protein